MAALLSLTPDELLTTTRSVRKRLDLTRPVEHMHEVPVHVIPAVEGRTDGKPAVVQAGRWGSILQAAWSFQLAARARGLGTCWTTFHLAFEEEAAQILGISYAEIMQAGLTPLAYTKGTRFKPAPRAPLETMVHWDRW